MHDTAIVGWMLCVSHVHSAFQFCIALHCIALHCGAVVDGMRTCCSGVVVTKHLGGVV